MGGEGRGCRGEGAGRVSGGEGVEGVQCLLIPSSIVDV